MLPLPRGELWLSGWGTKIPTCRVAKKKRTSTRIGIFTVNTSDKKSHMPNKNEKASRYLVKIIIIIIIKLVSPNF